MLICAHCGSQMIAEEKEFVFGIGWSIRRRCRKCGRDKFIVKPGVNYSIGYSIDHSEYGTSPLQMGERIKQEADMSKCTIKDCMKWATAYGYCNKHFSETFSITVGEYNAEKNSRSENPEAVAKRIFLQRSQNDRPAPTPNPPKPAPPRQAVDVTVTIPALAALGVMLPEDLYNKVAEIAKSEFRTISQQAAYFISKAVHDA